MEDYILNWFEVPVKDLARAKKFYETILAITMQEDSLDGVRMAYFPFYNGKPTGCLSEDKTLKPSQDGVLVYLNGGQDLAFVLGRVEAAGAER